MRAIILAAGQGTRLLPYTKRTPKSLLNVGGSVILGWQLDALKKNNINDVTIVVGFESGAIVRYVSSITDMDIKVLFNGKYEHTNNAYSLMIALEKDPSPFILMNGDTICHPDLIGELLTYKQTNTLAAQKKECNEEEMKVGAFSQVAGVITKDKSQFLNWNTKAKYMCFGEFMGIGNFTHNIPDLLKHLKDGGVNDWFEHAIQNWINDMSESNIIIHDVTHYPAIEIDFIEDLQAANDIFKWGMPDWEFGIRHGSERNLDDALQLLLDMTNILDKYEVTYWLNWGMLLGAYRDGNFIVWDTDIDITIHKRDEGVVLTKVMPDMKKLGCFIPNPNVCCEGDHWFIRDKEKIELNTVHELENVYSYSPGRCDLNCEKRFIDKLDNIEMRGHTFTIPAYTEEYLEKSYGSTWKTPIIGKKPSSVS